LVLEDFMRNVVTGGFAMLFGAGALLVGWLRGGSNDSRPGYATGQMIGMVFMLIVVAVGAFYLISGLHSIYQDYPRTKRKKRKRRVQRDDED
jgi:biotin transporter BioY